jgi:S-adenosyl-L-methionine hydrolase (adenosine-forming)
MNEPSARPIITLTTDFGLSDHYVGTVKGVLLSRCPDAALVDISHQVTAFSILEGAYTVGQAAPFYPAGTVHVVVVDPGVGTERRAIVAQVAGQYFVAPDNGVLSFVLQRADGEVREITNQDLCLSAVSSTFHGRDVFASVAGWIASRAVPFEAVGPVLAEPVLLGGLYPEPKSEGCWEGRVLSVDHFGNVITNFMAKPDPSVRIVAGRHVVEKRHDTFAEAPEGELFLYRGSSGYLEIGLNQGNAAAVLDVRPGDSIGLTH